jgi:glycosyltransferase involved in cell wall biosynthesis
MASPRVVVGVPLFNKEQFFREAIESLLAQTYRNFAVVLIDDDSTDATPAIAQEYAAIDPRVIVVRNPQRLGLLDNTRRAFEVARERFPEAEYFAFGSDHDLWHPRSIRILPQCSRIRSTAVSGRPGRRSRESRGHSIPQESPTVGGG